MGNSLHRHRQINYHESKATRKIRAIPFSKPTEKDIEFMHNQTGLSKTDLAKIFDDLLSKHTDGKLNRKDFCTLYQRLRTQPVEETEKLSDSVFRVLAISDTITLNEFLMVFALNSKTDLQVKLEYTFGLYDKNDFGALELSEASEIINGIFELLSPIDREQTPKKSREMVRYVRDCCNSMKTTKFVTKENFLGALVNNRSMRKLIENGGSSALSNYI
jgi:Ca2+-binding EF-hand superfamily protein